MFFYTRCCKQLFLPLKSSITESKNRSPSSSFTNEHFGEKFVRSRRGFFFCKISIPYIYIAIKNIEHNLRHLGIRYRRRRMQIFLDFAMYANREFSVSTRILSTPEYFEFRIEYNKFTMNNWNYFKRTTNVALNFNEQQLIFDRLCRYFYKCKINIIKWLLEWNCFDFTVTWM